MENDTPRPMTPFDELVTSPELQAVKLLLPYLPVSGRRPIAACVKFLELRQTLSLFGNRGGVSAQMFQKDPVSSPWEILSALRPYLGEKECDTLDMILSLKDMMNMMDMMPNTSGGNAPPLDPMDLLGGMLSPEQQELFRAFDTGRKGDESDERLDEQSGNEGYGSGETGADPDGSGTDCR